MKELIFKRNIKSEKMDYLIDAILVAAAIPFSIIAFMKNWSEVQNQGEFMSILPIVIIAFVVAMLALGISTWRNRTIKHVLSWYGHAVAWVWNYLSVVFSSVMYWIIVFPLAGVAFALAVGIIGLLTVIMLVFLLLTPGIPMLICWLINIFNLQKEVIS